MFYTGKEIQVEFPCVLSFGKNVMGRILNSQPYSNRGAFPLFVEVPQEEILLALNGTASGNGYWSIVVLYRGEILDCIRIHPWDQVLILA